MFLTNTQSQTYEQIINLLPNPDPLLECIIALPDEAGFIVSSSKASGYHQIIRLTQSGTVSWTKFLNSYSDSILLPNERLAYDTNEDVVIFVGQSETSNKPAYTILNASDGSHVKSKELTDHEGIISGVHASNSMGFYIAGHINIGSETNGLIGRIDPGDSTNNWHKSTDISIYDTARSIEYFDVTVDEVMNDAVFVGRRFPTVPEEGDNDDWDIIIDHYDADDGDAKSLSREYDPPGSIKTERIERILSLGNGTYILSLSEVLNFLEGPMMIHTDGTKQWGNRYRGYHSENPNLAEFDIIEIVYHPHGYFGMLFSMTNEDDETVYGLSGIGINGDEQWTKIYDVESLSDLVAIENGQFVMLGYNDDKNVLIRADEKGLTGCEEDFELNQWGTLYDLEDRSYPFEEPETFSILTYSTQTPTNPGISNGPCCWIAYEEFEYRHVWHCNVASLEDYNYSSGNNYTYQWYLADGTTAVFGATDSALTIDPVAMSVEFPHKGERVIRIEDENGCKGYDVARFIIIDSNQAVSYTSSGIEDIYCPITTSQYAPPLSLLPNSGSKYGYTWNGDRIGKYADPNDGFQADKTEDINNWVTTFVSGAGVHMAHKIFTEPATGCDVVQEYEFEILDDCGCNESFAVGSWNDQFETKIYGISSPQQNWNIPRYKITVEEQTTGYRYGISDYFGYPWQSEYWLKGFENLASSNYELCLEAWFTDPYDQVCGYFENCVPNIEVFARKSKSEGEGGKDNSIDLQNNNAIVFPNPSSGIFHLRGTEKISIVRIYNPDGKLLRHATIHENSENLFDISNEPSGIYILHGFSESGEVLTSKILIKE